MFEKVVTKDNDNWRLDKCAAFLFSDFSRTQIKKWILEGRVLVNGELYNPKDKVICDDIIFVNPSIEEKISWEPQNIPLTIIEENKNFIALNKNAGLTVHPGNGCKDGTLANGLLYRYPELVSLPRAGIVHRLDKDTSGIMIIAKSEKFRNHFIAEMQERKIKKNYIGVVSGIPSLGSFEINLPIGRDKKSRIKMAVRDDGRDAISIVSLKDKFKNYSMLDISIETGRTHQIRVHLAYNKLPLIGDRTYNPRANIQKDSSAEVIKLIREFPRQALHAHTIRFRNIDNDDELTFSAPLANDISELVKNLKTFA